MEGVFTMQNRNARFWMYLEQGLVKITLKRGQRLDWEESYPTEEGYSCHHYGWEFDGETVYLTYDSVGSDCDGPHRYCADSHCHIDDLHSGCDIPNEEGLFYPDWHRGQIYQQDTYAEAMGY
jgi:hypothetical protein